MNIKTSIYLFSGLLLLVLLFSFLLHISPLWTLIPLGLWLGLLAFGVFNIRLNFFLRATHRIPAKNSTIALTFDDGPHPQHTSAVLRLLRQYHVKATFFCIGKQIAQYPDLLLQIISEGHTIGNHSYSHGPFIDFDSKKQWIAEIAATDALIATSLHKKPLFFRPPYGVTTPHLAKAIRHTGHHVFGWNVRPYDTLPHTPDKIVHRILAKTRPGSIILLHDTHDRIIPVLEQLLPKLCSKNYNFATLEQFIEPPSDV